MKNVGNNEHKKKYTKEEIENFTREYVKCKNNFFYFCENYVVLELPGETKKLKMYDKQKELIDLISKEHYVVVLKSRQIGISTITQAYCTWLVTFHKNIVIGIISKDGRDATKFARFIMNFIDSLPEWMRPKFIKRTEQTFILDTGSKCISSAVNPIEPSRTLRGETITFLVIDEAAFASRIEDAWTGMVPALSTNQMNARKNKIPYGTIILSTPNKTMGTGAWFYRIYTASVLSNSIFKRFEIHWKQIPQLANDPEWYNTQCQLLENDQRKIQQELELKFLPSEGAFFETSVLMKLQNITQLEDRHELFKFLNGEVWKFHDPIPGHDYIIAVDTATERGQDTSGITVWDYQTCDQVWEYQGKLEVTNFVKVVKFAASLYGGIIVVENNSYGNQVMEAIKFSDMSLMLYSETKNGKTIHGLDTNSKTRPLMLDALYTQVSNMPECVKSKRLAMELIGLVEKNGKIQGDGINDDLAMTAAFAFYVRKYSPPVSFSLRARSHSDNLLAEELSFMTDLNSDNSFMNSNHQIDNSLLMRRLKNDILFDEKNIQNLNSGSYVDIMSLVYGDKK